MRRIVVFLILSTLAAPLAAQATPGAVGDGTMAVRDLNGFYRVWAKGAIVGRCDRCVLRIDEFRENDPIDPLVLGGGRGKDVDGDGDVDRYIVRDGRWRIIGGSFFVRITSGVDVDISLVGKGSGEIRGTAGQYSMNGGEFDAVPAETTRFRLHATAPQ